jgi:hypothetical protein
MFSHGDQFTPDARVEAAPFGIGVVLDTNAGHTGPLPVVDGAYDIQGVAVAGIAVGDDGDTHRLDDIPLDGELFAGFDEAGVGDAFPRG